MKKNVIFGVGILAVVIAMVCLAASSTQMINYQGRLTDSSGTPIDGTSVDVIFSIYDGDTASTPLWTETQNLTPSGGIYNVKLGAVNPLPDSLFSASDRWLGVKVGADPEMTPRSQITSVAYAMNSQRIAGKKIQSGQETLNVSGASSGLVNVTFPASFASPPKVITGALSDQIEGKTFIVDKVENITATGCDVNFTSLDGSIATGSANFDWIAIGE